MNAFLTGTQQPTMEKKKPQPGKKTLEKFLFSEQRHFMLEP